MEITATTDASDPLPSVVASVSGPSALSIMQREFARAYVVNGGKGTEAALAAGYAEGSAHVASSRNLVNPRVAAEIVRLSRSLIHAALPVAIQCLVELVTNEEVKPEIRRKAANDLLERGGMATEKAGVHLNVGVQVNGGQAQRLIAEVWDAKQQRLSDIPASMPDNLKAISEAIDALGDDAPAGDRGGVEIAGPMPGPGPLPPPSAARQPNSESGPDALSRWREATGEGEGGG